MVVVKAEYKWHSLYILNIWVKEKIIICMVYWGGSWGCSLVWKGHEAGQNADTSSCTSLLLLHYNHQVINLFIYILLPEHWAYFLKQYKFAQDPRFPMRATASHCLDRLAFFSQCIHICKRKHDSWDQATSFIPLWSVTTQPHTQQAAMHYVYWHLSIIVSIMF